MKEWVENFGLFLSRTLASSQKAGGNWPFVPGSYFVLDSSAPVAVSTLASPKLAQDLKEFDPMGLCIVGKTETENVGIEKVVKNVITNPAIRFLVVAGQDSPRHWSGKTFLALSEYGINEEKRVIESPGRHPILKNISLPEIEAFRKQVQVVDMIGCEDRNKLRRKIKELSRQAPLDKVPSINIDLAPRIKAVEPKKIKMDKAGYFVIILEEGRINVEHYGYDNELLRVIEGRNARSIYTTIIENGWITDLSHAAYLGKELTKAELSIKYGFEYVQDGT
ncbi:MAG: DUF4346 domain-containing protein [Deltaproteobacteria bacterium]|nr:DUF4346 domain-containing protein [Deltaproteobacteria bacterium]